MKMATKLRVSDRVVLRLLPDHALNAPLLAGRLGEQATIVKGFDWANGRPGGPRLCQVAFDDGTVIFASRAMIKRAPAPKPAPIDDAAARFTASVFKLREIAKDSSNVRT